MKHRIQVGDRVIIGEGHYWPWGQYGIVVGKRPIIKGKVIKSYWYVIKQDDTDEPRLFPRSYFEKLLPESKTESAK